MARGWPLLRRAPARLLRNGSLAAMILVSVVLLAGLVSAGPLFGSTTNAGGLSRRLAAIPDTASPTDRPVVRAIAYAGPPESSRAKLRALIDAVPFVGTPSTSLAASSWQLDEQHPAPYITVKGLKLPAVLFSRTGAEQALTVVRGTPGTPGVWLPDGAAQELGAKPGSEVTVGKTYRSVFPSCGAPLTPLEQVASTPPDTSVKLRVAGTYRVAPDGRLPVGSYYAHLGAELPSDPGHCPTTGLLVISDLPTIDAAITQLQEKPVWSYTATLTPAGRTPSNVALAAAATARLRLAASQPGNPVATLLTTGVQAARIDSGLPSIHAQADQDAAAAAAQGRGIAYAGGALGLAAVIMALRALAQRRRRETELLLGLGTPYRIVLFAGALELLLPAVIGAALGCASACLAFQAFGPQTSLEASGVWAAVAAAALVVVVTLVGNAMVTLAQTRQISRALSGRPDSRVGSQWLPLLTGATVLAVIGTLGRSSDDSYRDPMAALLPILVLATGCSLIVRAASWVSGAVAQLRGPSPAGELEIGSGAGPGAGAGRRPGVRSGGRSVRRYTDRLILRGLRRTGVAVADLVIVLSIGVGVLAYGLLSAVQVQQVVTDKASTLAGAESTAHITHSWLLGAGDGPAPRPATGTTVVWRATGVMSPDGQVYDVLMINPATFDSAADWGTGPELASARSSLALFGPPRRSGDAPLNALLIGPTDRAAGTTARIQVGFSTIAIAVKSHLSAFPGAAKPTVVLDARSWFPRLDTADDPSNKQNLDNQGPFATWVWSTRRLPALTDQLAGKGLVASDTFTLTEARATPELTSSRWAAAYQVVLGLAAVALAGLAVVVAVDRRVARAAPVDLVLKRFGIRPSRLLALRSLELGVTCLAALAAVVVPLGVMIVLLPRLVEPEPALPPSMGIHAPLLPLLVSAVAALCVTAFAALAAARRSATLKPGEVLRDDQ